MKVLDYSGLQYLWGKLKALIPTKTSDLTNDSSFITSTTAASTYVAQAQGAGNAGKVLGINSSGNVTPTEIDASEAVIIEGTIDYYEYEGEYYPIYEVNSLDLRNAISSGKFVILYFDSGELEPNGEYYWMTHVQGSLEYGINFGFTRVNEAYVYGLSFYDYAENPSTTLQGYIDYREFVNAYDFVNAVEFIDYPTGGIDMPPYDMNDIYTDGEAHKYYWSGADYPGSTPPHSPFPSGTAFWVWNIKGTYGIGLQIAMSHNGVVKQRSVTHEWDGGSPVYIFSDWATVPKPTAKTSAMTQAVGIDSDGTLWTTPSQGGAVATIKVWTASDVEGDD